MALLEEIQKCNKNDKVLYTQHARNEMINEKLGQIHENAIKEIINDGKMLNEYLDDKTYPSALIYGKTASNRPLHVVCAYNQEDDIVIIIAAYHPDPNVWENNTIRRKI